MMISGGISTRFALLFVSALLAGCATVEIPRSDGPKIALTAAAARQIVFTIQGSKTISESKDWEGFKSEWRKAMVAAAAQAGSNARYEDASAPLPAAPAALVVINVNDYRYVSQGARVAVGIMTGNAFIDADVSFFELPANNPAGTRQYKTSSSAGQGIFAPMTERQIAAVCGAVVREVLGR